MMIIFDIKNRIALTKNNGLGKRTNKTSNLR